MQSKHYMSKDDGPIIKVNLNEWAKHRKSGYVFRTELDYQNQQANAAEVAEAETPDEDEDESVNMDNTKAEILAFAEANGIEVDEDDTKAELLDVIDDALAEAA